MKLCVVASMGWFRWFGLTLWVAPRSWIASEIGFWFGLRFWVELQWLDFGERRVTVTVLCLWLWLRGGRGRLVVARLWVFFFFFSYGWWLPVEKWRKRKVVRSSYCCRNLWLWMVGQQWKWLLLLCCDVCCDGLVFFFPLFCWGFWIWNLLVVLLLIGVDVVAVVDDNREEIIYYFNV